MAAVLGGNRIRCLGETFLRRWHGMLGLKCQAPRSWHEDRIREELQELAEVATPLERLSEKSDVFFAIVRARYDGFVIQELPRCDSFHDTAVYAYMLGKYSMRCAFYRTAAWLCSAPDSHKVREVVNPSKDWKLEAVANRHNIDPSKFKQVGQRLRRVWPLLP